MQQNNKKFVIVAVVLVVAALLAVFGAKIYVGRTIKNPETRKEIESIIESGLAEIFTRPRVTITSLALKGFSTLVVSGVKVYDGKDLVFSAPTNNIQCSIFGQMLLGRCHAEAQINLGSDGNITFNMALPRSLLFAGEDYEYNLAGDGRIEGFNLFKLLNQKSTSSQSPLKLKGATAEGAYKFSLIGKGLPIPVIEFDGNIYKVMLEVNVMKQKKYEEISLPLAFKIERNKINFTKPVEVKLLGSTLKYTGALGFEQHLSWQGALQISSAGRFSRMVPGLFNCKSKPTNPLSFKISGLVGAPMCR